MRRKIFTRCLFVLLLLSPIATRAQKLPPADFLLDFTRDTYTFADTVQLKVKIVARKPDETHSVEIDAKVENSSKTHETARTFMSTQESVVKNGAYYPKMETRAVDVGTDSYIVFPRTKTYVKHERVPEYFYNLFSATINRIKDAGNTFFVSRAKSQGMPVFVLSSKKPIAGLNTRIIIGVEDTHFTLRRITVFHKSDADAVVDLTVTDQIFDAPLPAELFVKPPDDYKPVSEPVMPEAELGSTVPKTDQPEEPKHGPAPLR